MQQFTAKEVRDLTAVKSWPLRRCGMCQKVLSYEFRKTEVPADVEVYFNSDCDCTSISTDPAPRTWDDVAKTLNMQERDDVQARMVAELKGEAQADPQ